ncbi:MAG TPA: GNAT family N-acetyltransferase [Rudaea sp.]|nr:GNAT family N-acetyltransferase [Rudaea sp.]
MNQQRQPAARDSSAGMQPGPARDARRDAGAVALRAQTSQDEKFLFALYASTRAAEMEQLDWSAQRKDEFLAMQFRAQTLHYDEYYPDAQLAIIERDAVPIGRLYVDRREREIEIIDIALVPSMRGCGIGKRLLAELLDEGRATARRVRSYVEHFNPARGLYDRLGFRQIGTNGVYHEMEYVAR